MRLAISILACALASAASLPPLQVPLITQQKNGCGAASIAMVTQYWTPDNAPAHAEIYKALISPDGKGIELARMKEYVEGLGFRAFTIHGQWSDLQQHLAKGRPLIVGLRDARTQRIHFAVLTGLEDRHVWLNDPTKKTVQRADRRKFEKQWTSAGSWLLLATPTSRP